MKKIFLVTLLSIIIITIAVIGIVLVMNNKIKTQKIEPIQEKNIVAKYIIEMTETEQEDIINEVKEFLAEKYESNISAFIATKTNYFMIESLDKKEIYHYFDLFDKKGVKFKVRIIVNTEKEEYIIQDNYGYKSMCAALSEVSSNGSILSIAYVKNDEFYETAFTEKIGLENFEEIDPGVTFYFLINSYGDFTETGTKTVIEEALTSWKTIDISYEAYFFYSPKEAGINTSLIIAGYENYESQQDLIEEAKATCTRYAYYERAKGEIVDYDNIIEQLSTEL